MSLVELLCTLCTSRFPYTLWQDSSKLIQLLDCVVFFLFTVGGKTVSGAVSHSSSIPFESWWVISPALSHLSFSVSSDHSCCWAAFFSILLQDKADKAQRILHSQHNVPTDYVFSCLCLKMLILCVFYISLCRDMSYNLCSLAWYD